MKIKNAKQIPKPSFYPIPLFEEQGKKWVFVLKNSFYAFIGISKYMEICIFINIIELFVYANYIFDLRCAKSSP